MAFKFTAKKAERTNVFVKVFLTGIAGSGKTKSSLMLATGMADEIETETGTRPNIALFNTEASRGLYNAGDYDYYIFPDEDTEIKYTDFTPELYTQWMDWALKELTVSKVPPILIMDSVTPAWDAMKAAHSKAGGTYKDWGKVSPRWEAFTSKIVQTNAHIITCARGKKKNELDNENGKVVVRKLGVGAEVRENFDYEFTCAFTLDLTTHNAEVDKDNTSIFDSRPAPLPLNEGDGVALIKWANSGGKKKQVQMSATKASDVNPANVPDTTPKSTHTNVKECVVEIKNIIDTALSECGSDDMKKLMREKLAVTIKKYVKDKNGNPVADYRFVDSVETAETLINELNKVKEGI